MLHCRYDDANWQNLSVNFFGYRRNGSAAISPIHRRSGYVCVCAATRSLMHSLPYCQNVSISPHHYAPCPLPKPECRLSLRSTRHNMDKNLFSPPRGALDACRATQRTGPIHKIVRRHPQSCELVKPSPLHWCGHLNNAEAIPRH